MAATATAKSLALLDTENREVLKSLDAIFTHGNTNPVAPLEPLVFNGIGLSHVSAKDHHQPKMDEDESAKADFAGAKTSVWWDIENCEVPKGCDPHGVVQSIRSMLLKRNYCGPLTIYANVIIGVTKPKAKSKALCCKLCQVHCPNEAMYASHISGRKHKNKLKSQAAESR